MIKLKQLFLESVSTSNLDEYYNAVLSSFKKKFENEEDAETFIEFLKMNDEHISDMFGISIRVEKEDNGTLLIAYGENTSNIFLVGIVSSKDKMNRYDISAISSWIDRLIEKMKDGKTLLTTPHELSLRLIKHIEEKCNSLSDYVLVKKVGEVSDISDIGFILKDERFSKYRQVTLSLKKK